MLLGPGAISTIQPTVGPQRCMPSFQPGWGTETMQHCQWTASAHGRVPNAARGETISQWISPRQPRDHVAPMSPCQHLASGPIKSEAAANPSSAEPSPVSPSRFGLSSRESPLLPLKMTSFIFRSVLRAKDSQVTASFVRRCAARSRSRKRQCWAFCRITLNPERPCSVA